MTGGGALARKLDPELARQLMRAAGAEPLEPYERAVKPWRCRCLECHMEITPTYANVVLTKQGPCIWCAGLARIPEETARNIMIELNLEPLEDYPGVNNPWKCLCLVCKRLTEPTLYWARKAKRSACKWCAGVEIPPEKAVQIMVDAGWEPLAPYPGVKERWRSRHKECERISSPYLDSIKNGQRRACNSCANNRPITQKVAEMILLNASPYGAIPLELYRGARTPWKVRCIGCGTEASPRLDNIRSGQGVCAGCGLGGGFNASTPALIYLITNHTINAAKVGICNIGAARLQGHRRAGWGTYNTTHLFGFQARRIERVILKHWRTNLHWPAVPESAEYLPHGGWTETVSLNKADAPTLWAQINSACTAELSL